MKHAAAGLVALFTAACSSSGTNTSTSSGNATGSSGTVNNATCPEPAIPGGKTAAELTSVDYNAMCDWSACIYGGYGKTVTCTDGTVVEGPVDQSTCAGGRLPAACPATVSNFTNCVRAAISNQCANKVSARASSDCQIIGSSACNN